MLKQETNISDQFANILLQYSQHNISKLNPAIHKQDKDHNQVKFIPGMQSKSINVTHYTGKEKRTAQPYSHPVQLCAYSMKPIFVHS